MSKHYFNKALCVAVACYLLLAAVLLPADDVGKIQFEQVGLYKVSDDLITYNLWLKGGREYSEKKLNEDIKRLYETGYFTDVQAETTKSPEGKIDILFKLKNTPRVKDIVVKGNAKYDTKEILERVTIQKAAPLSDKLLRDSAAGIRKLYFDNGYYEAKVVPKTEKDDDGEVTVTFDIEENLRLKVRSVNFDGNTVYSGFWKLRWDVQTAWNPLNWIFDWGLYSKEELDRDEVRLRSLYWDKGYLDFSVKPEVKPVENDPEYVDVVFHIEEGQPYTVSTVKVEGDTTLAEKEKDRPVPEPFPWYVSMWDWTGFVPRGPRPLTILKPGETYDYRVEKNDLHYIKNRYYSMGFSDVKTKPQLETNDQTHEVAVTYQVEEGKKYSVYDVTISGNRIVKDYVLRRELPLQPGDPLDPNRIEAGKSRLMAMNYFQNVEAYTSASEEEDKKDVNYQVEEKGTAHLSIGAGWSTDDSLVGRLELSESDFDITDSENWFRGGGQRVSFLAQVGILRNDFSLNFTEPWLFGIPLRLDTSGFFHTRVYEYWRETHAGFDVELTKPFWEFNSVGLGYTLDFVDIYDMDDGYSEEFRDEQEGLHRRGALRANITRDTRDSLLNPTSGYLLTALAEENSVITGADANYYRLEGKASGYWPFFEKLLVLHLGTKIGTMGGFGSGSAPIFERYFLGGQDSIRGFEFRKVSPLNSNGLPLGGQSMFAATAELTHPIYKWIKGAPFMDIGNCWADPFSFGTNMNVGVGYGLRIMIPYINNTPIKLDLGIPIVRSNDKFSSKPQFYFNVGFDW